ncbi:hypothetical protein [Ligilactobacillus equi]|uniref:Uncharacterized protein n=1 Tax=Ligilactobacillus equi DSM 15833 = JCM 10991 TaxID=1423740 RepID=A0A0R1TZX4_9LACO|nr:hypothetical protein [Ligilactobacillus equi]KRL84424.1 hypothetical protein FC36_GL000181 [Ligilactobacillus equi DSM 15833 = JCM 10991]
MFTVWTLAKRLTEELHFKRNFSIRDFKYTKYDGKKVISQESIPANYMGILVDYLTRFKLTNNKKLAFAIPLMVYDDVVQQEHLEAMPSERLLDNIQGLDKLSVELAATLLPFDIYYRSGNFNNTNLLINEQTYQNTIQLVNRCEWFIKACKSKNGYIDTDVTFEGAYNDFIVNGDADFMTDRVLIDIKVSKYAPNENHAMQILLYYIMGLHSENKEKFEKLTHLAIYNPRLHSAWTYPVSKISNTLKANLESIMGYVEEEIEEPVDDLFDGSDKETSNNETFEINDESKINSDNVIEKVLNKMGISLKNDKQTRGEKKKDE